MKGKGSLSTLVMIEGYLHRMLGSFTRNVTKIIAPSKFYIQNNADLLLRTVLLARLAFDVTNDLFGRRCSPSWFLFHLNSSS